MKKLLLFAVVIFSNYIANAQWTQCPLYGGSVSSIVVKDSNVYTGISGLSGVYLSDDYAENWTHSHNGFVINGTVHVQSMAVNGDIIFAGCDNGDIYKTVDNGINWTLTYSAFNAPEYRTMLVVDTCLFGASPNGGGGVFLSTDSGSTWTILDNGMDGKTAFSIAYDDSFLYAGTDTGIYRSSHMGSTWEYSSTGLPTGVNGGWYDEIAANDTIVLAYMMGYDANLIFKSTDKGSSWTQCGNFGTNHISSIVFCDNTIFVGAEFGVYKSLDAIHWSSIYAGITNTSVTSLVASGSDLFAGTRTGVFYLAHDSTKWVPKSNGMMGFSINSIANIDNDLLVASQASGLFKTTDFGNTWASKNYGIAEIGISVVAQNGTTFYAGDHGAIYKSTNSGNSWQLITNTGIPYWLMPTCIIGYDDNIFIGIGSNSEGIYRSNDNGQTWVNSGLPVGVWDIAVNRKNEVFATAYNDSIYMSQDDGVTWEFFGSYPYAKSIAACDTTILIGSIWNPPMVMSNDYGATWDMGSNDLFGRRIVALKTIGDYVFVGLEDGIFFTKNKGVEWYNLTDNLPVVPVNSIGRDDSCIYIGVGGYGVWKRPLADFNIDFSAIPDNNSTTNLAIFPNPATDLVYINCEEKATVEIINMQGQIVVTKTISEKTGSIDVSGLGSGVYTLRIKTENGIVMKKMVKQ